MKLRRVHGDPKKKILLGVDEHQVNEEQTQRPEVKTRHYDCQKNPRPEQGQEKPPHLPGRTKYWPKGGRAET
jgi:hypothetical protein